MRALHATRCQLADARPHPPATVRTPVTDGAAFMRPHLRALAPYKPIEPMDVLSTRLGFAEQDIVKLDANENPYGPPPEVQRALAGLKYPNIYPDPESRKLRAALAKWHGLAAEHIMACPGADDMLIFLMQSVLEPGDCILDCPPTFTMYKHDANICGARTVEVPRLDDFRIDVPGIKRAVEEHRPKLLFLTSPNNPDGSMISDEDLLELLALPVLVVFDEAYIEFSDVPSKMRWVAEHENLIILRTFSKCAAMAGLRLGYAALPLSIADVLWRCKQPYTVTVATQEAGLAALQNLDYINSVRDLLVKERERLRGLLESEVPYLRPFPSESNFLLCEVEAGRDAGAIRDTLAREHGIMIRHYSQPELCRYIRVSVGKPEHTDKLIAALKALV